MAIQATASIQNFFLSRPCGLAAGSQRQLSASRGSCRHCRGGPGLAAGVSQVDYRARVGSDWSKPVATLDMRPCLVGHRARVGTGPHQLARGPTSFASENVVQGRGVDGDFSCIGRAACCPLHALTAPAWRYQAAFGSLILFGAHLYICGRCPARGSRPPCLGETGDWPVFWHRRARPGRHRRRADRRWRPPCGRFA